MGVQFFPFGQHTHLGAFSHLNKTKGAKSHIINGRLLMRTRLGLHNEVEGNRLMRNHDCFQVVRIPLEIPVFFFLLTELGQLVEVYFPSYVTNF